MINIKNLLKNKSKEKIDNIQQCVLSENEKKEIMNQIIKYDEKNKLSEEILYDIELLKGTYGNYQDSIMSKIDKTSTIMGKNNLENILVKPLKNIDELNKRQNIIKKILLSKDFEKINNHLQEIKENENNVLWLWKKNDKEVDKFLESVYFQNRFLTKLNDNHQFLNVFNYYKIIIAPLMGSLYPVIAILVPYLMEIS